MMHISSFLLVAIFLVGGLVVPTPAEQDLASFRLLTPFEQEQALVLVISKAEGSSYETVGLEGGTLETTPAVITMRNLASTPSRHYEFSFGLNRMLQELFGDAHTRVEVSNVQQWSYLGLDICLSWLFDDEPSLVSTCETDYANVGDLVVSLGGLSPADIFDELQSTIPHENDFFLRELPQSWLGREDFLGYLGILLVQEEYSTVDIVLERDGTTQSPVSVPLIANGTSIDNEGESPVFVSYEIYNESSTGVFTLDDCIFDQEYAMVLEEFWTKVKSSRGVIDTVVLDLRKNRGGEFAVGVAFLNHLADSYQLFDVMQRQSEDLCIQTPDLCAPQTLDFLEQLGLNTSSPVLELPGSVLSIFLGQLVGPAPTDKFDGELFVLTSGATFSSAHLIAGTVQENELGKLVGEPTGNSPSFWGNLLTFALPSTDLTFFLATSVNVLPLVPDGGGNDDTIYPDVLVPTTRQDIMESKDAQLDWVLTRNDDMVSPASAVSSAGNTGHCRISIFTCTMFALWVLLK